MIINVVVIDTLGGDAVVGLFGEYGHAKRFADQYDGFEVKTPRYDPVANRSVYDADGELIPGNSVARVLSRGVGGSG